jgi:predicted transcriptional regulator YheO
MVGVMKARHKQAKAARSGATINGRLEMMKSLLDTIAKAMGDKCEVVLHDFRQPERSIVGIAGNVTGRSLGGSVTQIGLEIMQAGDAAKEQYNYVTRSPKGRILKSSTVPLRDDDNRVFGAFCVNIDVTEMWTMLHTIEASIGMNARAPQSVTFVDDVDKVIGEVLNHETELLGRPLDDLTKTDRVRLLKALDARGVFSLQKSVPQVARHLGITRATLYKDLNEMRSHENGGPRANGESGRRPGKQSPISNGARQST